MFSPPALFSDETTKDPMKMEVKRRRKTCPMLAFSRFLPQKHSKREEGVCPVRGVVVSVCPSPPSSSPRPRWGKIKNDQKRFHSARKEQDSIHMGTHTFILTRVDGAGPTFRPIWKLWGPAKVSPHTQEPTGRTRGAEQRQTAVKSPGKAQSGWLAAIMWLRWGASAPLCD